METKFPAGFLWGGAIAANQAEGARRGRQRAVDDRYDPARPRAHGGKAGPAEAF